jgi:hypothetical protein
MEVSEAQRLWQMDNENRRQKQVVADPILDREALKAVIRKNGWSLSVREKTIRIPKQNLRVHAY